VGCEYGSTARRSGDSIDELLEERVEAVLMHDTWVCFLGREYRYGVHFWGLGAFYAVILRHRDGSKRMMARLIGFGWKARQKPGHDMGNGHLICCFLVWLISKVGFACRNKVPGVSSA
jgi:hypothetical protein